MLFTKILGFVAPIILFIVGKIADKLSKEEEKEGDEEKEKKEEREKEKRRYDYIAGGLILVSWIYSGVNIFMDEIIFSAILWLQKHWWIAGIYILCAAVLPSVVAQKECKKGTFWVRGNYVTENRRLNLKGVVASCAVFGLVYSIVKDFGYLRFFYIEDIIPLIASVSVWMAIIYQKVESRKYKAGKVDHDTSLRHMNQKLNLLHLFNVYFLAIVSVVYLVSYTIYCRNYHIKPEINPITIYILITLALLYFYALLQHELRYLYILSLILIPVILIASVYWLTWVTMDRQMRFWEWVFVFGNSMYYMFSIFKREKVIYIRRYDGEENSGGIKIGKWEFLSKNYFLLILFIVVGIIYVIVWVLPSSIDRLPAAEAYNYIDMICEGTDMDADRIIEMCEEQEIYNEADENYDIEAFMRLLSKELGKQMLEKGIINEEGEVPTRDILGDKLKNAPRRKNE